MNRFPIPVRWVIWGMLTLSIGGYIIVSLTMAERDQPGAKMIGLKPIFYGIGFLFFLLSQAVQYLVNHLRTPEGASRVPPWIDSAFILSLAFAELPAILALALGLSGATLTETLPLFVIAALGMAMNSPGSFYRVELRQSSDGASS